ncbi:hypothetical protein L1987_47753 [Smallanthus sonchifolius]|uniref:Uncharacterized protein n=1 Tax=Smallanthus sonchifolius TaxID=185202 RepID=A0ACB9FPE5_9ASTR|nr:hypothetical protein L1987_47753 [Smallanthus sonchifolius]
MNPSGGLIPPLKHPPDPILVDLSAIPSIDTPKIDGSTHLCEDLPTSVPDSATSGAGKTSHSTVGAQNRSSPYDRSPSGLASSGASPVPVMADKPPARALDEDGFTIVNRKGKNKSIKLPRKKNSGELSKQGASPSRSNVGGSGFNFARAVQGANAKPVKPPNQHPVSSAQSAGPGLTRTGTSFSELDIHASIRRTTLVEAASDLYPPDPMNEDGTSSARVHSDVMEHDANKGGPGKSYGISESQKKAIADRISVSTSIRIEETDDWCPGEWDYFNDLCISLGLDPDYCIEDVESDTENGTAQFFLGLLKAGCPKPNRC